MIITNEAQLNKIIKEIEAQDVIAIDTETDGLNVRINKVIGIGFSFFNGNGYYIADQNLIKIVLPHLNGKRLIAFNGYFDLEMLNNNYKVDLWKNLHADVLLLKHTVDEEFPFGLKEIAAKIFGHSAKAEQEELKASIKANGGSPNEFFKADLEIIAKYCIQDCKLTFKLFNHYSKLLESEGLVDFFYNQEVMPLYKEVTRFMQSNGVKVDLDKAINMQKAIQLDMEALEDKIQASIEPHLDEFKTWLLDKDFKPARSGKFAQGCIKLSGLPIPMTKSGKYSVAKGVLERFSKNPYIKYVMGDRYLTEAEIVQIQTILWRENGGKYMFNLLSKHHLKKLFFDKLGEKALSFTDLGNPQVNDEFIEEMGKKYDWAKWLSDYNKLAKLKSAYIDRILDSSENGYFYPAFHQHRTISGRYGSDLQQLPRLAEEGQFSTLVTGYRNRIRELFIAGESRAFIDSDYESLEPHIFAHVSGEKKIQNIFQNGDDFYSTIAIMTEGLQDVSANKKADNYLGKINKGLRQKAKAYSLGIPYGMEDYALSKTLEISQHEASKLVDNYLNAFPNLKKWMDWSNSQVAEKGHVISQAGRKRRFPEAQLILKRHGMGILNSLALYEDYKDDPENYAIMKELRKKAKNALNNAKNFQIQSLAASITNKACIEINRFMKYNNIDGHVAAQIHDQIIVDVPKDKVEFMRQKVQEIMESVWQLDVKLKAPAEIGYNFAEAH